MHVCAYAHTHVCMNLNVYVSVHGCMNGCTFVYVRQGNVFLLRLSNGENRFNPDTIGEWNAALDEVERVHALNPNKGASLGESKPLCDTPWNDRHLWICFFFVFDIFDSFVLLLLHVCTLLSNTQFVCFVVNVRNFCFSYPQHTFTSLSLPCLYVCVCGVCMYVCFCVCVRVCLREMGCY